MGKNRSFLMFLRGGGAPRLQGHGGRLQGAPGRVRWQREGEACVLVSSKEWVRQGKGT